MRYVVRHTLAEKTRRACGDCVTLFLHVDAEMLESSHDAFESSLGSGILGDAALVVLLRPVDDLTSAVGNQFDATETCLVLEVPSVFEKWGYIGFNAIAVFFEIECFVATVNGTTTEVVN